MQDFLKENWFKLAILLVLLVIAFILYTALVVAPEKRAEAEATREAAEKLAAAEQKQKQEEERQSKIDTCLAEAHNVYTLNWNGSCKTLGRLSDKCEIVVFADDGLDQYLSWHPELESKNILEKFDAFLKAKNDCSCALPTQTSSRWDDQLAADKKDCYSRY